MNKSEMMVMTTRGEEVDQRITSHVDDEAEHIILFFVFCWGGSLLRL